MPTTPPSPRPRDVRLDPAATQVRQARELADERARVTRFLAAGHVDEAKNVITDVRGDVLRIGFGIYQDEDDVERLVRLLGELE